MIYLMRHGADPSERYGGWSAYGLTEKGKEQVHTAKRSLCNKGITKIYSSDLTRAKETAEIVANALSLGISYLPQFRESNNGLLAGMLKTEATEKYPGVYWNALDWKETWPEGESPEQFFHRIQNAWCEFKKQVGTDNVLLVSHGGVMNIILCLENGIPYTNRETHFRIKDAEIVQLDIHSDFENSNMHRVFGVKEDTEYLDREGAYIIPRRNSQIGVVQTPKGYFFLGGGLENDESHLACIERECLEEAGCIPRIKEKLCSAEAYIKHPTIGYFHPIQTYYIGELLDNAFAPAEADHVLCWIEFDQLKGKMFVEMQNWALEQLSVFMK